MGYIYKITNDINKKIYIGKTDLHNPIERWNEHLRDYKKKRNEKRPLYEAMNKYGEEYFHFEIIEETNNTEEREQYWIDKFRTYIGFEDCNGYNATLGGDGKCRLSLNENDVVEFHINEGNYQLSKTKRHFGVDSKTIKKILERNNIKWLNSSQATRSHYNSKYGCIYQVDINTGNIINIFNSATYANESLGKNPYSSNIRDACNGRKNSHFAYGSYWYYEKDYKELVNN